MDNELRSLIEQGKIFFKNQNYKKAEACFKKTLGFKHDFADVYNYMGLISHEGGHYSEAIRAFEKALKINPRYTEALLNLSILYNDMGEYDRAKRLVKRSRDEAHKTPTAIDPFIRSKLANKHADVGDLYWGVGAYAQAVQEYKRALELGERYVDIRTKMAICLRELGKKAEALAELKLGLKDNPDFADAYTQLGVTLYSMGKKSEARKIWKSAAKKFSNNKTLKMYLTFTDGKRAGRR